MDVIFDGDAIELRETRIMAFNDVCINCTACVRVCPVACITIDKELKTNTPR